MYSGFSPAGGTGSGYVSGAGAGAGSERIPQLDIDLEALAAVRHVDAPEDVRVDEGAEPDARGDLRPSEGVPEGAEDLASHDEGVDAPVRLHAEDVRPEEPDALLELQRPGLPVEEAIQGESAEELVAPQRALPVERSVRRADGTPREARRARDPVELRQDPAYLQAAAQEGGGAGQALDHPPREVEAETALRVVSSAAIVIAQVEPLGEERRPP